MGLPPIDKTMRGLLVDLAWKVTLLERRLGKSTGPAYLNAIGHGTTVERDARWGAPGSLTDAQKVELANAQVVWFNTTTRRSETYYAVVSLQGLTVPGLAAGFTSGWFAAPSAMWAGKSGPTSMLSAYKNAWNRGEMGAGSAFNAAGDQGGIIIGLSGIYEAHAHQRGGSASDFLGLSINGDRLALENRPGGVWTHDHSAGGNGFTNSFYLGPLTAGEILSAGPPVTGGMIYGGSTTAGGFYLRRVT